MTAGPSFERSTPSRKGAKVPGAKWQPGRCRLEGAAEGSPGLAEPPAGALVSPGSAGSGRPCRSPRPDRPRPGPADLPRAPRCPAGTASSVGTAEDEEVADIDGAKLVPQPAVKISRACRCRAEIAQIGLPDGRPAVGEEAECRNGQDQEQRAQGGKPSGNFPGPAPEAGGLPFSPGAARCVAVERG